MRQPDRKTAATMNGAAGVGATITAFDIRSESGRGCDLNVTIRGILERPDDDDGGQALAA